MEESGDKNGRREAGMGRSTITVAIISVRWRTLWWTPKRTPLNHTLDQVKHSKLYSWNYRNLSQKKSVHVNANYKFLWAIQSKVSSKAQQRLWLFITCLSSRYQHPVFQLFEQQNFQFVPPWTDAVLSLPPRIFHYSLLWDRKPKWSKRAEEPDGFKK